MAIGLCFGRLMMSLIFSATSKTYPGDEGLFGDEANQTVLVE
jgi:hypothetical protein